MSSVELQKESGKLVHFWLQPFLHRRRAAFVVERREVMMTRELRDVMSFVYRYYLGYYPKRVPVHPLREGLPTLDSIDTARRLSRASSVTS